MFVLTPTRRARCAATFPFHGEIRAQLPRWLAYGLRLGALCLGILAGPAGAQSPPAPAQARTTIGFVEIAGDPRHEPLKAYERLVLRPRDHPFAGAQVGIEEAQSLARVLKTDFALERMTVKSPDQVAPAVLEGLGRDIHYFVIDAPAEAFKPLAAAVHGRDVLLFNATAPEDTLRRQVCASEIVHTIPSLAMTMDGLVQYLVSRKWPNLLALRGPQPDDAVRTKAFENSAKKYGARLVATQDFKAGTDPREREKNDPLLLTTTSRDYDVVFVADEAYDFARDLPYHTQRPRPVVGATGLRPVAWDWTWERNGAPQVNSRFQKLTNGRHMSGQDWAAWIAVKMVAQAALRTRTADFNTQRQFILGGATFDGDKGLAVSIRPWDHQLRQAILLATPDAVIASAPVEGFLHRTNVLDTLGDDEAETPCKLNK